MTRALKGALSAALLIGLGVAAWCCGPTLPTPVAGEAVCPSGVVEVCEPGDESGIGLHNCYCPPE